MAGPWDWGGLAILLDCAGGSKELLFGLLGAQWGTCGTCHWTDLQIAGYVSKVPKNADCQRKSGRTVKEATGGDMFLRALISWLDLDPL